MRSWLFDVQWGRARKHGSKASDTGLDPLTEKNNPPPSVAGVLGRLRAAGLRPLRARDQHFLHDPRLLAAIVEDAEVSAQERVFEVGTGPGTLTRELAAHAAQILTVDLDPKMIAFAQRELAACHNVRFLCADVLDGRRVRREVAENLAPLGEFVWVGNLPYSIATTLIIALLEGGFPWTRGLLLVQEEVAARLSAVAGSRTYGPVTVLLAFWAECRRGRRVASGAFWPPPKVESAFIHLTARAPLGTAAEYRSYAAWVRYLFGGRRKQLQRLLRERIGRDSVSAGLQACGAAAEDRPERLAPDAFLALAREFPLDEI